MNINKMCLLLNSDPCARFVQMSVCSQSVSHLFGFRIFHCFVCGGCRCPFVDDCCKSSLSTFATYDVGRRIVDDLLVLHGDYIVYP